MLSSLLESIPPDLDFEILLIDDFSSDGTREWLQSINNERVHFHLNSHNLGYSRSNNVGAKLAKGRFLGLLNNDLIFKPGWLEPMLRFFDSEDLNAGLVGNVQFRVADNSLDHAGVILNLYGQFEHAKSHPLPGNYKPLAVTGACVLIEKSLFEAADYFDETFRNGCEDIDLCFKVRALGKEVYLAQDSLIHHHVSLSRGSGDLTNLSNSKLLFKKWRFEIKTELTKNWLELLEGNSDGCSSIIPGAFTAWFLSIPQVAAPIIAESIISHEELYWESVLDGKSTFPLPNIYVYFKKLNSNLGRSSLVDSTLEINLCGMKSFSEFRILGQKLKATQPSQIAITITLDAIHEQRFLIENDNSLIDLRFTKPITLPQEFHRLELSIELLDKNNQPVNFVGPRIAINQLFLNGIAITDFK